MWYCGKCYMIIEDPIVRNHTCERQVETQAMDIKRKKAQEEITVSSAGRAGYESFSDNKSRLYAALRCIEEELKLMKDAEAKLICINEILNEAKRPDLGKPPT